jgi:2',3'-cyclic-nucleotide 2'-phosphodiesterase (5'-nucleotidase family)
VLEGSRKLREGGANAVILVSHMGNDCNADYTRGYWEESTFQQSTCSPTDEMSLLLNAIPQGTIDGVVQGHRHKFSHHFINGVPVMGTINGGYYFNIMYLFFYDKKIYNKAIDGPWPVCEKVFSNLGRCNYLTKK